MENSNINQNGILNGENNQINGSNDPISNTQIPISEFDPENFKSNIIYPHPILTNFSISELVDLTNLKDVKEIYPIYPSILHLVQSVNLISCPDNSSYQETGICSYHVDSSYITYLYPGTQSLPRKYVELLAYMCSSMGLQKKISQIIYQMEFWFSDANLVKDEFLRNAMDKFGYVFIGLLKKFNRLIQLNGTNVLIQIASFLSLKLELCDSFTHIRRTNEFTLYLDSNLQDPTAQMKSYATFNIVDLARTHLHKFQNDSIKKHDIIPFINANIPNYQQGINPMYKNIGEKVTKNSQEFINKIQIVISDNDLPDLAEKILNKSQNMFGVAKASNLPYLIIKNRHPHRSPEKNIYWFLQDKGFDHANKMSLAKLIDISTCSSFKCKEKSCFYRFSSMYLRTNLNISIYNIFKELAIKDAKMGQREGIEYLHDFFYFYLIKTEKSTKETLAIIEKWCEIINVDVFKYNYYCIKYVYYFEIKKPLYKLNLNPKIRDKLNLLKSPLSIKEFSLNVKLDKFEIWDLPKYLNGESIFSLAPYIYKICNGSSNDDFKNLYLFLKNIDNKDILFKNKIGILEIFYNLINSINFYKIKSSNSEILIGELSDKLNNSNWRVQQHCINILRVLLFKNWIQHDQYILHDILDILSSACNDKLKISCIQFLVVYAEKHGHCNADFEENSEENLKLSDFLFLKICKHVIDISKDTRLVTVTSLGTFNNLTTDTLMQSLDKKLMSNLNVKLSAHERSRKLYRSGEWSSGVKWADDAPIYKTKQNKQKMILSCGVFIHALEDDCPEVRNYAIKSMLAFTKLSEMFLTYAHDFFIDMISDESDVVRISAIEALQTNADKYYHRDDQLYFILGLLKDNNELVRHKVHRFLGKAKILSKECLSTCVNALLINIGQYNIDKFSIFRCIQKIGEENSIYVFCMIKKLFQLHPYLDKTESRIDNDEYITKLILCVNASKYYPGINNVLPDSIKKHYLLIEHIYPSFYKTCIDTYSRHLVSDGISDYITKLMSNLSKMYNEPNEDNQSAMNYWTQAIQCLQKLKYPDRDDLNFIIKLLNIQQKMIKSIINLDKDIPDLSDSEIYNDLNELHYIYVNKDSHSKIILLELYFVHLLITTIIKINSNFEKPQTLKSLNIEYQYLLNICNNVMLDGVIDLKNVQFIEKVKEHFESILMDNSKRELCTIEPVKILFSYNYQLPVYCSTVMKSYARIDEKKSIQSEQNSKFIVGLGLSIPVAVSIFNISLEIFKLLRIKVTYVDGNYSYFKFDYKYFKEFDQSIKCFIATITNVYISQCLFKGKSSVKFQVIFSDSFSNHPHFAETPKSFISISNTTTINITNRNKAPCDSTDAIMFNEKKKQICTFKLGLPIVICRVRKIKIGSWMLDLGVKRKKYYVTINIIGNTLYEYNSIKNLKNNNFSNIHYLPFNYEGTSHIIDNNSFYFKLSNSSHLIKYNLINKTFQHINLDTKNEKLIEPLFPKTKSFVKIIRDNKKIWLIYLISSYLPETIIPPDRNINIKSIKKSNFIKIGILDNYTIKSVLLIPNIYNFKYFQFFIICNKLYIVGTIKNYLKILKMYNLNVNHVNNNNLDFDIFSHFYQDVNFYNHVNNFNNLSFLAFYPSEKMAFACKNYQNNKRKLKIEKSSKNTNVSNQILGNLCANCMEFGHTKLWCNVIPTCENCLEVGHYTEDCITDLTLNGNEIPNIKRVEILPSVSTVEWIGRVAVAM
ncbi:Integrator complex subunit 4-like protein 1 [Intoshia linei]|uniref:Integrator complex subunit 4-like protein 1 n=1 Tax=Intoshia linei TaxID=1819745 RepID=A0A177B4G3_9BILA|nr:Integrator complex subunit 4-like protein 1 [Intoshia linei]